MSVTRTTIEETMRKLEAGDWEAVGAIVRAWQDTAQARRGFLFAPGLAYVLPGSIIRLDRSKSRA
jgi:hypothetical protein